MALGNGSAANGGVAQEKAPVVNGTNMETLPRQSKQQDPNTAFLRAARAGQLDKIQEYLDSGTVRDINTSNANGLNALHLAAKDGHVEVVQELLKRDAIVDAATKKGNTALHIASLAGQEDVVRLLIQHSASINVQSQNGFTPLYMAAQENHDGVVKYLLAKGGNQTLATEDGFTPLAVAMQQGHDKVVAVLLENDTRGKVRLPALHIAAKKDDCKAAALLLQNEHNADITSKSGFTPLHIAAHYGNDKVASLLYEKGADINYTAKHNITPLHVASKWGKMNMVSLLVAKGADIQAKTRDGLTPLHCAARSGHDQVVDMLLENGAPMHSKTKNGLAPLHMAAQGEHVDAARSLLYHGAPVDEVTVDYLTALHVAAHCGHIRVAKLLLDRGADPNARALNGFTPLHIACKKNRQKMVELLLKHGANIGATTESGLTPLHVASFMGCMNIVIYLLQREASPDIPTVRGETPLHLAARANQTDIIRILLRNGAAVDARAREEQTPLHVASRLGNVDIVMLLLQHGAQPHATTKDLYTPLHIAAKEGQEEVASVLLDNGADLTATTKKGFTPLHLASKYGHLNVARLLLQRDAPADAQGKNKVTPLHVAAHYDHQPVALLLLDKGASPHAVAKNGHTPLHIAARKNQMDIATTLLEYGAHADAESKAGFTPLHLSAQEGHSDMSSLLLEHQANPNHASKNGLTPLHLCAQEDRVSVAKQLLRAGAVKDARTKQDYTPLHVACHHGHVNIVRVLIEQGAEVNPTTTSGYTPLHQAAQQGHVLVINLLLKHRADPNAVTNNGQTALGIANKLGYISVVEELKVVTEVDVTTTTTVNIEEKYKVVAPEAMQETFMSDSEDEGGGVDEPQVAYGRPTHAQHVYLPYYQGNMNYTRDDLISDQQQYKYMTVDDMKSFGDDSMRLDVTNDEKSDYRNSVAPSHTSEYIISPAHIKEYYAANTTPYTYTAPDNVDINRQPITCGVSSWRNFLVSFLVDARGGAMRGCRHSGVRVIVPPRCAASPTRITCRYVRPKRMPHPPPLMEGEALASRVLELAPVAAKFLGPVIIEVPHFASLRVKQREIIVLRSDNGETWKEHTLEANEEAIQDVLQHSFEGEELSKIDDLHTNRITRILTNDFPHYFAVVSRVRQEVHAIGPDGGTVSSSAVPLVQAVFPANALTKKIRVGLQAQALEPELVSKLLGHAVAVSPIVTVEPRRRKFHKAITLSLPAPRAHSQGMINQYSGSAPTLRLLCSITGTKSGGQNKAVWEDVTGSTPLSFVKECVSFTTTVSARFWLMDCRNVSESAKMATELYTQAAHVPFMAKFVVFVKRVSNLEARVRVFCMTDDKEDKTLEQQEHFVEIAKSRDIEVMEGKDVYMEFAGNLVPVLQSGDQPKLNFKAFRENRIAFTMRIKDQDEEPEGRIVFMNDPKVARGEPNQIPLCTLNLPLPKEILPDRDSQSDLLSIDKDHSYLIHKISPVDTIHRADFRLTDISNLLDSDWDRLARELGVVDSDIQLIHDEYSDNYPRQAMVMLRLWLRNQPKNATGNNLERALNAIGRSDIVQKCICNVELVTDDMEQALAKVRLDQSGFEALKDELGPSRDTSLRRDVSLRMFPDDLDTSEKMDENLDNSTEKDLTESEILEAAAIEEITQKLHHNMDGGALKADHNANTPPPSPAEFNLPKEPLAAALGFIGGDSIELLKKNVSDTLTFLHQERNDFLPQEDIIIPSRKDDHVAMAIDLGSIKRLDSRDDPETFNDAYIESEIVQVNACTMRTVENVEEPKMVEPLVQINVIEPDRVIEAKFAETEIEVETKVIEPEVIVENNNVVEIETAVVEPEIVVETKVIEPEIKVETKVVESKVVVESKETKEPEVKAEIKVVDVEPKEVKPLSKSAKKKARKQKNKIVAFSTETVVVDPKIESSSFLEEEINCALPETEVTNQHKAEIVDVLTKEIVLPEVPTEEITIRSPNKEEVHVAAENEVSEVIKIAEGVVNDIQNGHNDPILSAQIKSEEAFKFLEDEASSPIVSDDVGFEIRETAKTVSFESPQHKSNIPVPKRTNNNKTEDEKDLDLLLEEAERSKIPLKSKVKTIKKHSKDPLKERFTKLSLNWDDDEDSQQQQQQKQEQPIVKTTVTRIRTVSSSSSPEVEVSARSKIPVLMTETTRIVTTPESAGGLVSPDSRASKSSTLDSDSDTDSRRSPPLKGILKKTSFRTVGSSSGSDVALHEAGAELSDSESEDFYQHEPQFTETIVEEVDPITGARITRTVRTMTQTSPGGVNQIKMDLDDSFMKFMAEERHPQ
ncbi:PREDICTED: ankyrin-3-like isoform X4 [Nicrophorus vespilloides]|uniref:Ankyrin-3-like isoform X4 n=1 Tax=Nicrophorus vespilloides TaxID=110193 RepID=A0ABM1MWP4_NICVS|nr:PREDICTED: ankyrin-3-like isoform X4 [Nicrophorus vespilloides]